MNSILYMYLHVLLKYNARVAVRAQQLRGEELQTMTQRIGSMTRPIIAIDWGESYVTKDRMPPRTDWRQAVHQSSVPVRTDAINILCLK